MKPFSAVLLATTIIISLLAQASADEAAEQAAIHNMLNATFDKPDMRLTVNPVVVEEAYAIADWTQGDLGGRGLLRKNGSGWTVILCGGDGLKSADLLKEAGVPQSAATKLSAKLATAESKLDDAQIAQFSRFNGVVYMEQGRP